MRLQAMVLDVVSQNERFSTVLLKEMGSTNEFVCNIFTYMLEGIEVGNICEAEIKFQIKHKIKNNAYHQTTIIKDIKKIS